MACPIPALVNLQTQTDGACCITAPPHTRAVLDAPFAVIAMPLFATCEQCTLLHCFEFTQAACCSLRRRDMSGHCGGAQHATVPLLERDADSACEGAWNRVASGADAERLRSKLSSCCTIWPSESVAPLASLASVHVQVWRRIPDVHESDAASVLDDVDISVSAVQLFADLRLTSPAYVARTRGAAHGVLANLMREVATVMCMHYYTGTAEAAKDVQWLGASLDALPALAKATSRRGNTHGERERRLQLAQRVLTTLRARVPVDPSNPYARCPFVLSYLNPNPVRFPLRVRGRSPPREAQAFRDAYVHALSEARVLRVVQNTQHEAHRRFAEVAGLGWEAADAMQAWLGTRPLADQAADRVRARDRAAAA
ncbi:hypothetical protein GGX14DRAFT_620421 [Mycena pura]|uniref:Uncharacterized protein n=1 Tax=Mycena pura TaxID=153505 RepID=A0AAD6VHT1_9AGAR|nr:hypothetical protein GGX14DRAFT_620421 [Mycena pura]